MTAARVSSTWSCTVRLVVDDDTALDAAAADLDRYLAAVGRAANRFDADSELSRLNAAAGRTVTVSPLLGDLLAAALDAAADTAGACDPTVGAAVVAAGYDRDISELADLRAPAAPGSDARWADVRFDRDAALLWMPAGTALDLGATGKAFAADAAARRLHRAYGCPVLVEIGGDLAVAGTRPDGWTIRVAERQDGVAQLVTLHSGGLATSTTTIRRWRQDGVERHHLIDPATGLPADGPWRTATVCAASAVAANAASTAAIVRGADAPAWLAGRHLPARLVATDGTAHATPGWPVLRPAEAILDLRTSVPTTRIPLTDTTLTGAWR